MSDRQSKVENSNETRAPDEFWCYFIGGILALGFGIFLCKALLSSSTADISQFKNVADYENALSIIRGKALYNNCIECHGDQAEGNQQLSAPALAHLKPWYIIEQYQKFKSGLRVKHTDDETALGMTAMSKALDTDQDIADVTAYIGGFKNTALPAKTLTDRADLTKGQAAYALCLACHGADGQGKKSVKSATIAGLNDWYIIIQLDKLKKGIRGANPANITSTQMRQIAMTIPDGQSMINLAAYVTSLGDKEKIEGSVDDDQ